jgi:hypothetical protein
MSKKNIPSYISKFEDKVITFLQNLGNQLLNDVASYSRRLDNQNYFFSKESMCIYVTKLHEVEVGSVRHLVQIVSGLDPHSISVGIVCS